ncbi:MAG TPA: hypothetical protein VIV40_20815 [Kofleriaceae bacterium]
MRWGLAVVVVVLVGCKPHVTLVPPPPDATPDQRVQAFNQLHAVSEKTTTTTSCGGGGGCSTTVEKELNLANGTRVYYPDDLLPVVHPESESAREVHAARRAVSRQRTWALAALGFAIGGVVIFTQTDNGKAAFLIGGGGILVSAFFAWRNYFESIDHISRANETYNAGLAQRLDVCVSGFYVVPCETTTGPTPPPAAPVAR